MNENDDPIMGKVFEISHTAQHSIRDNNRIFEKFSKKLVELVTVKSRFKSTLRIEKEKGQNSECQLYVKNKNFSIGLHFW